MVLCLFTMSLLACLCPRQISRMLFPHSVVGFAALDCYIALVPKPSSPHNQAAIIPISHVPSQIYMLGVLTKLMGSVSFA